jgi:5-methylcytosine-specific restriction endonuclease McrA
MVVDPGAPMMPQNTPYLPVLQLNADYTPNKVLRWERAVELLMMGKAVTCTPYPGRFVRSPSLAIPWPAVIVLCRYSKARGKVGLSARNVLARDGFTCQYCGLPPRLIGGAPDRSALTLDHVVPRAQAREGKVFLPWARRQVPVTSWENVVTACRSCNLRKADRTPAAAGMTLRTVPRVPTQADGLRIHLARYPEVPVEWEAWLPESWHTRDLPHSANGIPVLQAV